MTRRLLIVGTAMLAMSCWSAAAERAPFTIMTQNMDAGTDLTYVAIGASDVGAGLGLNLSDGVGLTYAEILTSAIPQRAAMLAARIAERKPDLVALEEVTTWKTGDTVTAANTPLVDQLEILLANLAALGVPYQAAIVNQVSDTTLPMSWPTAFGPAPTTPMPAAFRMIDHNVLLVRAELKRTEFTLSEKSSGLFNAVYSLGGLEIPCGWISAKVQVGDRQFRLLVTHLQSPVSIDPTAADVQEEQAQQLIGMANDSKGLPVVLAGDFNSDANFGVAGPGPDNTGTAATIIDAGYADAWAVHRGNPGVTWPFYLEDQLPPPPFVVTSTPFERIDLIFSKDLQVLSVDRVVAPIPGPQFPYYGSDHAGVMARFKF